MLGSAFAEEFKKEKYDVRALSHEALDVTDRGAVLEEVAFAPDIVVHTAGIVNADYCEEHRDECITVHVSGTENVIELCKRTGAKLLFPQSFLIFDGEELPIVEETTPHPLSVYGEAKWMAEQKIRASLPDALIVRMGGFFGGFEKDKNFVGMFARFLKKNIAAGNRTLVGTSRVWQPTATDALARNSRALIEAGKSGIYTMASHGSASFFDVAQAMVEVLHLKERMTITEVPSDYFHEKCRRPENGTMENKRLKEEGLDMMPEWRASLAAYLSHPYFTDLFSS
jgi:dTDP-4-dehydrorhamnose reductase